MEIASLVAVAVSTADTLPTAVSRFLSPQWFLTGVLLLLLAWLPFQLFSRPPPVPLKKLPRRPALSILFKPHDDVVVTRTRPEQDNEKSATVASRHQEPPTSVRSTRIPSLGQLTPETLLQDLVVSIPDQVSVRSEKSMTHSVANQPSGTNASEESLPKQAPTFSMDLPDSFAPLLSSSKTEFLLDHLTPDLIHGLCAKATVRLHKGRREIPLDKNPMHPQFTIDVPSEGIKVSAVATAGSDGFSTNQDLDPNIPTTERSRPMVKQAELAFDPPLPLLNVSPTLIHIHTLFEDHALVPHLRRIYLMRYIVESIVAVSHLIEQILWLVEGFLQIHLGKIHMTPIYKGPATTTSAPGQGSPSPDWRLSLAFSGHVLLFGFLPIPFIHVTMPTFVIPQPHALLHYLLSDQPLASARIKRENISETKIALAMLDIVDSWTAQTQLVVTPPAIGIDLTLWGGLSLGVEILHGRDPIAGRTRQDADPSNLKSPLHPSSKVHPPSTGESFSSWTSNDIGNTDNDIRPRSSYQNSGARPYDANNVVPWKLDLSAKGSIEKEKLTVHLSNFSLEQCDDSDGPNSSSLFKTSGSCAIWKAGLNVLDDGSTKQSVAHRVALATDTPSVAAIMMFPDVVADNLSTDDRMLKYDYAFQVSESTQMDALTFSVGGNHPMLNGGSMVTTICESLFACGSVTARQNAILDPKERKQKRNILRHLPAIDFTFGIQNMYIPPESQSYTDDGQTTTFPEMEGGRVQVRFLGGMQDDAGDTVPLTLDTEDDRLPINDTVAEGIKVITNFGVSSITLGSETMVREFPELEVFEGAKLRSRTSSNVEGTMKCHLRPTMAPDMIFNPLEAYEIDCSGSSLAVKIKESITSLGHRRLIIPTETTVNVIVVKSVVDMTMEGQSSCELSWDFQGLSPVLQVVEVGFSPERVAHEQREQVAILVGSLRQGRLKFHVSPVGGINITKAATSREDKEGLYDWKFFNALVSPDQKSVERLLDVVHDRRSMNKILQVINLINKDAHRLAKFLTEQIWRVKEICDNESISEPKHIVPAGRLSRFLSLFICDSLDEVDAILRVINRVVAGDGLDVVTIKDLLHKYCSFYDNWTPEMDRAIRWLGTLCAPVVVQPPVVEFNVTPLAQLNQYVSKFRGIPSARQLYEQIMERSHLPLEPSFSNLVGRVAPYLSFHQIEFFLKQRASKDWDPSDLKRLRYVYSVKKRVLEIAESYGGLSFLPQSFLVSVFLGEATQASLRASQPLADTMKVTGSVKSGKRLGLNYSFRPSTLAALRQRRTRLHDPTLESIQETVSNVKLSAAGRVASLTSLGNAQVSSSLKLTMEPGSMDRYELGDCLLGPGDVAILLQAGLTSVMKGSSVVQLNQRMLLDLISSQPNSFAVAVLAEIGSPGGQGSPRQLTSALLALLELDQTSFRPIHKLNLHKLLESWLPGLRVPKRDDYMAGGRWARQSYYDAIFALAKNILEDAECYMALKSHLQRVRHASESDPIPMPRNENYDCGLDLTKRDVGQDKLGLAVTVAQQAITQADKSGAEILGELVKGRMSFKNSKPYGNTVIAYRQAFEACGKVLEMDKLAFQSKWFRDFYRRNYDALMILSVFENVMEDVERVRYWLHCLRRGDKCGAPPRDDELQSRNADKGANFIDTILAPLKLDIKDLGGDKLFLEPERHSEQAVVEAIIDALIYDPKGRESMKKDPLVRLLIKNPPGNYKFTVVSAMGVITDGKEGKELQSTFERLEKKRGVRSIRSDTATARSLEYNAGKIIEAIGTARQLKVPFGLLGYSQGCANALMAENLMYSGTPEQQRMIGDSAGLVSRQLLFSAANASIHGPAMDKKIQRLVVQTEEFLKYQQGYVSRALQTAFLEATTNGLDSPDFHKAMGGAQTFLSDGCRAFWREAQHLSHVPTCSIRGVLEEHTLPEALTMLSNLLTKQSGSALHDSQVHVNDTVGHPVAFKNRNAEVLEKCYVGDGAIQRTHHWSPLTEEVQFITTARDDLLASFDCAKDRHIFPWVDVNARFGFIKYADKTDSC
eukprot:Nitzschia sp. Nitz4//scaffold156_size52432//1734//7901//NITZ4_006821-RA/size52432-snap-gene-0.12-mRNA-1//-1//CDS//3329537397//7626//frame0